MFDHLDDIHSQALSDSSSRDPILRIDLCMNWGVSTVLLPEFHCSHFMGSIIPLMTRLSLTQQMIEVHNVNWGGYYPGGRRAFLVVAGVEEVVLAMGDERKERLQREVYKIYSANKVANSNAGVNGDDSNGRNSGD
jgi:hypothetical protein